jgi:hypothetical protein
MNVRTYVLTPPPDSHVTFQNVCQHDFMGDASRYSNTFCRRFVRVTAEVSELTSIIQRQVVSIHLERIHQYQRGGL